MNFPTGVAVDPQGYVMVMDGNDRVEVFRPDGAFVLAFGSAGSGTGQFTNAAAIDVDPGHRIVVLDKDNSRVQVFADVTTPARRSSWKAVKSLYR